MEVARKRNKTRFKIFLVDEYSADVYQAAAYGSFGAIENDEERVARLHEAIAEKADPLWRSPLAFPQPFIFGYCNKGFF